VQNFVYPTFELPPTAPKGLFSLGAKSSLKNS
jgi:hypothetical protein